LLGTAGAIDAPEVTGWASAGLSRRLRRAGNLLQELAAIRITIAADRAIVNSQELRHKVEVADRFQKLSNLPKFLVGVNLLQVSLG